MNKRVLLKRAIAVLNFPRTMGKFILAARAIAAAMGEKTLFAALTAKITKLLDDIITLEGIILALNAKQPEVNIGMRQAAQEIVKNDLRGLCMEVQMMADADPENAVSIIESAGMKVKLVAIRQKQQNSAVNGVEEGSIDLTAEGAGPHDWRMSTNEQDWTRVGSTFSSKTTVFNLVPGTVCYFQNQKIYRKNVRGEWSGSIKIRVR